MKKIIKKIILRLIPSLRPNVYKHPIGELLDVEYGHSLSIKTGKPVNKEGQPLPWFTYSSINFLSSLDLSDKDVLEWGSGNSSLFLAERVKSIVSIESDQTWFEEVSKKKFSNQEILFASLDEYEFKPEKIDKKFDVVIVDGEKRYECAKEIHKYLKDDGIVILDNSDWYKNSAKIIRDLGLIQTDFSGFGPINNYTWTTSVFFTRKYDFKPIDNILPKSPIGGLNNVGD